MLLTAQLWDRSSPASSAQSDLRGSLGPDPCPQTAPDCHIPFIEVEKLVQLSEAIDINDDEVTPAQCYDYLRRHCNFASLSQHDLSTLKTKLSPSIICNEYVSTWSMSTLRTILC
jgi:hypothetical protein